jgi:predicted nucleic acid-binding protein
MKILIDTNVILDVLCDRTDFVESSSKIWKLCEVEKIDGYISALSIPYMLVVGGKEEENEAVSVRSRFKGDEGQMKLDDFLDAIKEEIANRENRKVEKED